MSAVSPDDPTSDPTLAGPTGPEPLPPSGETTQVQHRPPVLPVRSSPPAVEPPPRAAAVSAYELGGEIARGGMGRVLAARDGAFDRPVAVKVLHPDRRADPGVALRFLEEARITGHLQHPGIPPVHALGTLPDGGPFLVMKLIKGRTLADVLGGRAAARDLPYLLQVFEQICHAVGFAHAQGVVHRDLKPANVMVGDFGEVQVMDWGLAKAGGRAEVGGGPDDPVPAAEGLTVTGQVMGTPGYMPPEQARGEWERVGPRADVFALGGILCAVLTGKPPHTGDSTAEVLARAAAADLSGALDRLAGCGAEPELVALARRCLATDPAERPADAGELARLVAAYRAGAGERSWRRTRRVLAMGTPAVVVFLALLAGLCWWVGRRAYEQTERQLTHEVRDSLARTAWYGGRAVEQQFQGHVEFVERAADELPDDLRGTLAAAADRVTRSGSPEDVGDRAPFDGWVWDLQTEARRRWPAGGPPRTVALLLAAGDPADPEPAHGFTVSRSDGTTHPAKLFEREPDVYRKDGSFRGEFTGRGTEWEHDGKGLRHPVATRTHVTRAAPSGREPHVWQASVVTPVWSGPGRTGRVVGLLSVGLRVDEHLVEEVRLPGPLAESEEVAGRPIAAFLVDDADRWVWHPDAMAALQREAEGRTDGPVRRDPEGYRELAARYAPGEDPAGFMPWRGAEDPVAGWAGVYTDLVQAHVGGDRRPEVAHVRPVRPFARSAYPELRGVRWALVVQADRGQALEPLADLRRKMVVTGSAVVLALAALAAGLWAWLVRALRRLAVERAGHPDGGRRAPSCEGFLRRHNPRILRARAGP